MRVNHLGLLFMILIIGGAIFLGGSYKIFLNLPSFIIVFGTTAGGLIFKFGYNWRTYLAIGPRAQRSFCQYGRFLSITVGVLGTVVAFVQCFANITNYSSAGVAFSISILATVYGLCLGLFFHILSPLDNGIERDLNEDI